MTPNRAPYFSPRKPHPSSQKEEGLARLKAESMGDAVDLRDDRAVRFTYLHMLMDWGGNDLNKVYEPVSRQIGIVFFTIFAMVGCYVAWNRFKKWREERKQPFIPYKVIKAPSSVVEDEASGKKKRVCAILGGTGFIGSHVVDEFVKRGECRVYMLGRKFRPKRTNPAADALIQVDMEDWVSLTPQHYPHCTIRLQNS